MQGIDAEDTDRWFGMFRFVGAEALGEQRHQALRGGRQRQVRNIGILAVFLAIAWSLAMWLDASGVRYVFTSLFASGIVSVFSMLRLLRTLSRIRPGDGVDVYEGRVPLTQGFRDDLTDKLVSMRHVGTARSHRLTVHSETSLLLEVDGTPVRYLRGKVVTTARVGDRSAGVSATSGDRRALTQAEVAELDAIISRSTRHPFALAAAYATLVALAGAIVVLYLTTTLRAHGWWLIPMAFASTLVCALFLLRKNAEGQRARAASDRAGGLVRGATTWRLPVLDLIWERDGLPGFQRLERGGLDVGARSSVRPRTF